MGNDATRPALPADTGQAGEHTHNPLVRYFKLLGPGLVTGASDDDPSGITTYSVAGASLGYGMLWTAVATLPLTIAVQLICARIGLVSGSGRASWRFPSSPARRPSPWPSSSAGGPVSISRPAGRAASTWFSPAPWSSGCFSTYSTRTRSACFFSPRF